MGQQPINSLRNRINMKKILFYLAIFSIAGLLKRVVFTISELYFSFSKYYTLSAILCVLILFLIAELVYVARNRLWERFLIASIAILLSFFFVGFIEYVLTS